MIIQMPRPPRQPRPPRRYIVRARVEFTLDMTARNRAHAAERAYEYIGQTWDGCPEDNDDAVVEVLTVQRRQP